MSKGKYTKQDYEDYLNEIGENIQGEDYHKNYGTWLRRNDPIQFSVGYNEWVQERNYKRGR